MHKLLRLATLGMVTAITLASATNAQAAGMLEMAESTINSTLVAGETSEGKLTERGAVPYHRQGGSYRSHRISRRIRIRPRTLRGILRRICRSPRYRDTRVCRYSR